MRFYSLSLFLVFVSMGLSSCGHVLQRSDASGYAGQSYLEPVVVRNGKRARMEDEAREDMNLYGNALSEKQRDRLEDRIALKTAEAGIPTKKERAQYYRFYSYFDSDRARLYFLNLPDYEAKERYLQGRGFYNKESASSPEITSAIESQDIILGMTPKHVMESWGDPDAREVAGSMDRGNERWRYSKFIPQADGFEKEVRVIYFEHGRVVGWEKLH